MKTKFKMMIMIKMLMKLMIKMMIILFYLKLVKSLIIIHQKPKNEKINQALIWTKALKSLILSLKNKNKQILNPQTVKITYH